MTGIAKVKYCVFSGQSDQYFGNSTIIVYEPPVEITEAQKRLNTFNSY